ncbi:hypothetical protein [Metabacillus sp. FJAT-53654]|uniref:Uncharacterized protein n=1 Tax=Metabacillus rhizosphaerae TaxID=3117747 RepID=A0ABZ2MNA9_9BACI
MKKFPTNLISNMFYTIFVVSTIITLFIVYKDIDNSFAIKFVIGYVVFLMLFIFYFIVATVNNMRKVKWVDIIKRMYRFISTFVLLSGTSIIYCYFFRQTEIDYYRIFHIALGLSLGIAFFDLAFSSKKNVD